MIDPSSLLANSYSGISPLSNLATVVCEHADACVSSPGDIFLGFFMLGFVLFLLAAVVLIIVSKWKVFHKAGQPGWASIVPIYSFLIDLKIIRRPWWWIFLVLIPGVGFVVQIIIMHDMAKVFGKGVGFILGLIFLPFIFYPILAFGDAKYTAPAGSPVAPPSPASA